MKSLRWNPCQTKQRLIEARLAITIQIIKAVLFPNTKPIPLLMQNWEQYTEIRKSCSCSNFWKPILGKK